jgi:hypothetical protein
MGIEMVLETSVIFNQWSRLRAREYFFNLNSRESFRSCNKTKPVIFSLLQIITFLCEDNRKWQFPNSMRVACRTDPKHVKYHLHALRCSHCTFNVTKQTISLHPVREATLIYDTTRRVLDWAIRVRTPPKAINCMCLHNHPFVTINPPPYRLGTLPWETPAYRLNL